MDEIAELIVTARTRSGLSRQGFAERVGTSRSAIDEYEAGRRSPSLATVQRILGCVGFDVRLTMTESSHVVGDTTDDLASFAEIVDVADPAWTWRLLTSDFLANVFAPASTARRVALLRTEPARTGCARHDALIAGVAEYAAVRAEIPCPSWAQGSGWLGGPPVWFPVHGALASTRAGAMALSPAPLRRRCIQVDGRDLPRIDR